MKYFIDGPHLPRKPRRFFMENVAILMVIALVAVFILMAAWGLWVSCERQYNAHRWPQGWNYERGVKFSRFHGTVAVKFHRGTVYIWRDNRWLKVREG